MIPKEIAGYSILREIGAGGMGTVYEATDIKMNRRVALKVLSRRLAASSHAADRFAREAWIGGKLSHPGLVRVFERGESDDFLFYSMEMVEGCSLADLIGNLKLSGRDESLGLAFTGGEYLRWAIRQIVSAAMALDHAHKQGIVHRDIKPANILLDGTLGIVKIADFGLAIDTAATRLTTAGKVLGTVAYMAPEQIRGKQDEVSARTDVYSLGVTLFELVTLQLPYRGETQQLYLNAVLTTAPRHASRLNDKVSRDLEIVLHKTLEKNPLDRYASAAALASDLENVLQLRPITARPPAAATRIIKWTRRRPIHAALTAALILGVPTVATLSWRAVEHQRLLQQVELQKLRAESRMLLHQKRLRLAMPMLDRILNIAPDDQSTRMDRALAL
ncbi:MAG TPA: serine/threonine-protein kinase, partial [Candidatus Polarisedimenticolia bacterium]|nr:serine/threonine-protein kinase [Candidatus Polarisedimenticolia bacterium]